MVTIKQGMAKRSRRLETAAVLAAVLVVGVGTGAYALTRGTEQAGPELLDWQRSAFADLGQDDQAIFSALNTTAVEIGWLNYDSGLWPAPEELEAYSMPPFVKDAFWEQHGSVKWEILVAASIEHGGSTAYFGTGGTVPGQSAYMLLFQHRHMGASYSNQSEVWMHPDINAPKPQTFLPESLIRAGWKKVVIYSGADEAERIRG